VSSLHIALLCMASYCISTLPISIEVQASPASVINSIPGPLEPASHHQLSTDLRRDEHMHACCQNTLPHLRFV